MFGAEILSEIDTTIDRLIKNAEAMQENELTEIEKDAFQKTQESLLAHMMYMDQMLAQKRKELTTPHSKCARYQIQDKLFRFRKLNLGVIENLSLKMGVMKRKGKARIAKRRG